jgi:hypothetical protein
LRNLIKLFNKYKFSFLAASPIIFLDKGVPSRQTLLDENKGVISIDAINNGFHLAFTVAAIVAAIAAMVAFVAIRKPNTSGGKEEEEATVVVAPTG